MKPIPVCYRNSAVCPNPCKRPAAPAYPLTATDLPPAHNSETLLQTNTLWPKLYGGYLSTMADDIDECYDKAYLVSGNLIDNVGWKKMPFLMKTDVNGTVLWEKRISYLGNSGAVYPEIITYGLSANLCHDGGILVAGGTHAVDHCADYECSDAFVMKINPCGEKQWCRIIRTPEVLSTQWKPLKGKMAIYGYWLTITAMTGSRKESGFSASTLMAI